MNTYNSRKPGLRGLSVCLLGILLIASLAFVSAGLVRAAEPTAHVVAYPGQERIEGTGFTAGGTMVLTIEDGGTVVYSDSAAADGSGAVTFDLASEFDLQAGQVVTVSDGLTTKTLTVAPLAVTWVDVAADVVYGTGNPAKAVDVSVQGDGQLTVTAGAGGAWQADFSGQTDLTFVSCGSARQADDDGDATAVAWCASAFSGARTMGFWQNKNGREVIRNAGTSNGVCKLTPWLRFFAPFRDLSSTASCSAVETYVARVVKAANAKGVAMNAALKGQMLAAALDVYFSDPALGGNKLGAGAPIGGLTVDLTRVLVDDGDMGAAYINASAAFGGATEMTIMDMLVYAAPNANAGGSVWYGNVKSTQELAKAAFAAVTNQTALAP